MEEKRRAKDGPLSYCKEREKKKETETGRSQIRGKACVRAKIPQVSLFFQKGPFTVVNLKKFHIVKN